MGDGELLKVVDMYLQDMDGRRREVIPRPRWWEPWAWLRWYFLGEYVVVLGGLVRVKKLNNPGVAS